MTKSTRARLCRTVSAPALPALQALVLAALTLPALAAAADLELTVGPLASARGSLRVAVYASAAEYRRTAIQSAVLPARAGAMTLKFANLAPGEYAVAVFHDLNDNDKLDENLLGAPSEPWAVSVLTGPVMRAPRWDDVKFTLPAGGTALKMALRD